MSSGAAPRNGSINARDVKLELLRSRLAAAKTGTAEEAQLRFELQAELNLRARVDQFFDGYEVDVCGGERCNATMRRIADGCMPSRLRDLRCQKTLIDLVGSGACLGMSWTDYSGKYATLLADLCDHRSDLGLTVDALADLLFSACSKPAAIVI